jgi:hypothetical protein
MNNLKLLLGFGRGRAGEQPVSGPWAGEQRVVVSSFLDSLSFATGAFLYR